MNFHCDVFVVAPRKLEAPWVNVMDRLLRGEESRGEGTSAFPAQSSTCGGCPRPCPLPVYGSLVRLSSVQSRLNSCLVSCLVQAHFCSVPVLSCPAHLLPSLTYSCHVSLHSCLVPLPLLSFTCPAQFIPLQLPNSRTV